MSLNSPPIRLIALDLDGTTIDREQKFSPRVKRAIAQAQRRGVVVTLATGRSHLAARPFADALDIRAPLICFQGGLVAEPDGRVLHRVVLDRRLAADMLTLAESRDWHVTLYVQGRLYLSEMRCPPEFYSALLNPVAQIVPDLRALLARDPDKLLIIANGNGDAANGDQILADLRAHFAGQAEIVRSHELFIEANPLGVDKGRGLAWLAEHLRVPQAEVMAIGDHDNDAPMVAWAGLGVAMGNGSRRCQAVADWIAPPISQDGAAWW